LFLAASVLALTLSSIGCKNSGKGGSHDDRPPPGASSGGFGIFNGGKFGSDAKTASAASNARDPLLGKIPKQNLPTADGSYGSTDGLPKDPLFRTPQQPVTNPKASATKSEDLGKATPFRRGPEVTSAALASRTTGDGSNDLVIDDRRPIGTPTSGPVPLRPVAPPFPATAIPTARPIVQAAAVTTAPSSAGLTVEMLTEELRKIGAKPYAPVRLTNGDYEFRCAVPINDAGAMRSYTGTGTTPVAAVSKVYEQIRSEK